MSFALRLTLLLNFLALIFLNERLYGIRTKTIRQITQTRDINMRYAIATHNQTHIKKLLKQGTCPNLSPHKDTYCHLAAGKNDLKMETHFRMLQVLLEAGAYVDRNREPLSSYPAKHMNAHQNSENKTDQISLAETLDVLEGHALQQCSTSYKSESLWHSYLYPFQNALERDDRSKIDELLAKKARISHNMPNVPMVLSAVNSFPLHWAIRYGSIEMCGLLMAHGACIHLKNKDNERAKDIAQKDPVKSPFFEDAGPFGQCSLPLYAHEPNKIEQLRQWALSNDKMPYQPFENGSTVLELKDVANQTSTLSSVFTVLQKPW